MNRGINDGGDLPRELLNSLYESIKTEPFKIPEDDGNDLMPTFFNPGEKIRPNQCLYCCTLTHNVHPSCARPKSVLL